MDFKSLLSQLDQLNEATTKTKTGLKHTAEPGGYGRKDDEDEEGNKVKAASTEKRGKGRPKKATQSSGEDKKYDFSAFGVTKGKDVKLPKHDKKKTTKHSLKEYFDAIDQEMLAEAEQIQIKPANQMPKQPGQMSMGQKPAMPGQQQQVAGQPQKQTQVIAQGNKTLGTVDNPQLAQQIKQSIGKGEMTLMPDQMHEDEVDEGTVSDHPENQVKIQKQFASIPGLMDVWKKYKHLGDYGTNLQTTMAAVKKEFPRMDPKTLQSISTSLIYDNDPYSSNSMDAAFYAAKGIQEYLTGAQKKIREADQPPNDSLMSPIGEGKRTKADDKAEKAGKKVAKDLEYDMKHKGKDDNKAERAGKKVTKDIEYDEKKKVNELSVNTLNRVHGAAVRDANDASRDGDEEKAGKRYALAGKASNKAELKNRAAGLKPSGQHDLGEAKKPDANKNGIPDYAEDGKGKNDLKKKKVKEGMDHRVKAARHAGKAHALGKQGYNCTYDDMGESRSYHEGYKEGLDECYGQMPIQGYVGEANPVVNTMASYGAHTPQIADEGNAFTDALKKTPQGGKFTLGGKSFTDHSAIEESPFAFESLDKQLNALLEGEKVDEGMTVSISKGQQGQPDSVSVSAQDAEADQLLGIIKSAGLGLFGGDEVGQTPQSGQPMTVDVDGGEGPEAEIEVVDDHDDMLSLIRKMTGQGPAQSNGDYEEEGGEEMHGHEHGEEETCESCGGMMEEGHACGEAVEEDESMDQREYEVAEEINPNNNDEAEEEQSDATRDAALATAAGKNFADTDAPLEEGGDGGEAGTDAIQADDAADTVDAEEEDLDESLANGADDQFETDIDFMTRVISGGLNKQKSTGQTTIPVVSTQVNRLGSPMKESTDLLTDWRKLSGIK